MIVRGGVGNFVMLLALVILAGCIVESLCLPKEHSTLVYRTVGDLPLRLYVFESTPEVENRPNRPAVVIFHGGGWTEGEAAFVFPMCRYLAARGMVAIAAEYRLADGEQVTPLESMEDAQEVMYWIRRHASELGIEAHRVAAAGLSAGGHLAASAVVFCDSSSENSDGCRPDALLLWFPAVTVTSDVWFDQLLRGRMDPAEASPSDHVRPGLPPTIIFQGTEDHVTPLAEVRKFVERMRKARNRIDLHIYQGRGHAFTQDIEDYIDSMEKADRFLSSEGFLRGEPNVDLIRRSKKAGPEASR